MTPIISAVGLAIFAFVFAFVVVPVGERAKDAQPRRWFEWLTDLRLLLPIGIVGLSLQLIGEPVIRPHILQYALLIAVPAVSGLLARRALKTADD